jgi:YkoY family integral membrane protein
VKGLPPEQRGRALRYGIIGAYIFRIAALALATRIMTVWWVKVAGGVYLLWMAWKELTKPERVEGEPERRPRGIPGFSLFWSTVVAVELTDIIFSVDSIAAAVALSDKLWVLILGGLLGILAMRFAAQGFVRLLEVFPRLETAAFIAVGVIGLKLLLEFPADVAGRSHVFPAGTVYGTAEEYTKAVHLHAPPLLEVPHVLILNNAAAPPPEFAVMDTALRATLPPEGIAERVGHEFDRAESQWILHFRPFIEIEGWVSSLVVLLIFAGGFVRRK